MRKIIFTIVTFLSFFSVFSQYRGTRQNGTLQTTEDYVTNSPGNSISNSRLIARYKDSTDFSLYYNNVRFAQYLSSRNDGTPTTILWTDADGNVKKSPIPSWITSESDPVWTSDKINYYDKSTSDARYLQSFTEVDGSITNELEPVGVVEFYAGVSAPTGYLMCDGSAVSRTTYSALFSITGSMYGNGDGSTTFNLPDLRQRFPLTKSVSGTGSNLGSTGGSIDHLHTVDPPNTTTDAPSGTVSATILAGGAASTTHTHDVNIAQFNSGTANPPFLVLNAIIKY